MKKLVLCLFFSLMGFFAFAEEGGKSVKTSTENGRYEIIQSELARRQTFRLDKKTGSVFLLVTTKSGKDAWEEMEVIGKYVDDTSAEINYQIFIGGTAASDCFLINIYSGKTWQLFRDTDTKTLFWAPMSVNY